METKKSFKKESRCVIVSKRRDQHPDGSCPCCSCWCWRSRNWTSHRRHRCHRWYVCRPLHQNWFAMKWRRRCRSGSHPRLSCTDGILQQDLIFKSWNFDGTLWSRIIENPDVRTRRLARSRAPLICSLAHSLDCSHHSLTASLMGLMKELFLYGFFSVPDYSEVETASDCGGLALPSKSMRPSPSKSTSDIISSTET